MSAAEPNGRFFLDTNVLVYCFDDEEGSKRGIADRWVQQALRTQRGVISYQVVQEFLSLSLLRFAAPFTVSRAREYLATVLRPLCRHWPSGEFYDRALELRAETGYHWYDALIVTAALDLGCATLLTEDLQHGRVVRGLTILNPFVGS
ncbi:MAG: PIN domain-containing protein [Armatimonadetes bacterium]|nr:PIN domain-containing protein [Armatimonadota bacterium]